MSAEPPFRPGASGSWDRPGASWGWEEPQTFAPTPRLVYPTAPAGAPGQAGRADVTVRFENAPRGTRPEVDSSEDVDLSLDMGYAMGGL